MNRTRLQWAEWMVSKGITAFILNANSKSPFEGQSWYVRNTSVCTNPNQLTEWFEETPNCNYGLWLGEKYVVIDLDVKHSTEGVSGIAAFEAICAENGVNDFLIDFNTLMVNTPSGGYHLYFKTPFKCANKNTFPNLIDVRGAVGYVVGPGSADERGEWSVEDPDMPIMDIPDFLLEYLFTPSAKDPDHEVPLIELDLPENIQQAMDFLKTETPAIEGENGDHHTYEVCCYLRDFGVSEGEALRILFESGWNARCEPPWDATHLEIKIKNSYSFGQNRPGVKAITYATERLISHRPTGGWGTVFTDEQFAAMSRPKTVLELIVDNTDKEDGEAVPEDTTNDDDPLAPFRKKDEQFWYGIQEFAALENVREYLIKGWLIAHGVTALLAKRGTGKSIVALDLACHIAKDMDWWGTPIMKGWKVIYICGEDDEGMILNVRAWGHHENRGIPSSERFMVAKGIIKMTNKRVLAIRLKEMLKWADGARCLIILDTWARATSGSNSNTQEEMDMAYENAEAVATALCGPMIPCFHPPKNGRELTIRGSAVQEDASSGIWELEEVPEGLRLTIGRAKGRGKGNYRKFRIKKIELAGEDIYKDKNEGIVPICTGGTEITTPANMLETSTNERRAWAKAIVGAFTAYPAQNPERPECSNTVSGIAKFMVMRWVNGGPEGNEIDKLFVKEWMDEIKEHNQMCAITREGQDKQVAKILELKFLGEGADHSTVIIGEHHLSVEQNPATLSTYRFTFEQKEGG